MEHAGSASVRWASLSASRLPWERLRLTGSPEGGVGQGGSVQATKPLAPPSVSKTRGPSPPPAAHLPPAERRAARRSRSSRSPSPSRPAHDGGFSTSSVLVRERRPALPCSGFALPSSMPPHVGGRHRTATHSSNQSKEVVELVAARLREGTHLDGDPLVDAGAQANDGVVDGALAQVGAVRHDGVGQLALHHLLFMGGRGGARSGA